MPEQRLQEPTAQSGDLRCYRAYLEAVAPSSDVHWFDVSWERKWWGGKVLKLRECFPLKETL